MRPSREPTRQRCVDQCVGSSLIGLQPLQHHQDATSRMDAWWRQEQLVDH